MKKTAIVSCYFQHNYGSMLQAYATQMALDKLGYENETIDISGFNGEIKKAKLLYFAKASLTSDILLSKLGMARNVMIKKFSKNQYAQLSKARAEKFDAFSRKQFRLSPKYNSKAELGNKCKENYSSVLVGSDQLWLPGNIAAVRCLRLLSDRNRTVCRWDLSYPLQGWPFRPEDLLFPVPKAGVRKPQPGW